MNTESHLITRLLEANGAYVSGNDLANELGLSRVSVWHHIEALKKEGFAIEAKRNNGYRLDSEPEGFHRALIEARVARLCPDISITTSEATDSTNSDAATLLATGATAPGVVVSALQRAGRGRLGRHWHSPSCGNLYASVYFRPLLVPGRMARITLWLGLAVCEYLHHEHNLPVMIKWPNDLLLDGKKIAGMLSESRIDADLMRDFIFGIGLNINGNPGEWPAEIRDTATSLAHWRGGPLPFAATCAGCIHAIIDGWQTFAADPTSSRLTNVWPRYDALEGRKLSALYANQEVSGIARGINNDGTLRLELSNGDIVPLASGEVTLRTQRTPSGM